MSNISFIDIVSVGEKGGGVDLRKILTIKVLEGDSQLTIFKNLIYLLSLPTILALSKKKLGDSSHKIPFSMCKF